MDDPVVALRLDGRVVAEYVVAPDLDPRHGPRPFLHPVFTRAGVPVTDALPEDHVWHLGASLAVQDVAGTNLWGGRTYVRDAGYTWLDDHGRIVHDRWLDRRPDRLAHRLRWCDRLGRTLLTEERLLAARAAGARGDAWVLDVAYTLTAPPDRDIPLGSPATNGRPGGAGYGGFFWRAAPGAARLGAGVTAPGGAPPDVFTAGAAGEEAVNGSVEPWVALVGAAYTLVFFGLGKGDRWFVRAEMYPGVCVAFAFDTPRVISAGAGMPGRHSVVVADGRLDRAEVLALLADADVPA